MGCKGRMRQQSILRNRRTSASPRTHPPRAACFPPLRRAHIPSISPSPAPLSRTLRPLAQMKTSCAATCGTCGWVDDHCSARTRWPISPICRTPLLPCLRIELSFPPSDEEAVSEGDIDALFERAQVLLSLIHI